MTDKKKIAVLGGGVGALTAAYELTNRPCWRDEYEITVYQMGWRCGGKGASGRALDDHDRIEEHGLHMFFGFYENAFRMMRAVYRELGRHPDAPLATWDQAFRPHSYFALSQEIDGQRRPWVFQFPESDDVPGSGGELPSPWGYIQLIVGGMLELYQNLPIAPNIGREPLIKTLPIMRAQVAEQARPPNQQVDQRAGSERSPTAWERLGIPSPADWLVGIFRDLVDDLTETVDEDAFLHMACYLTETLGELAGEEHERVDLQLLSWLLHGFLGWLHRTLDDSDDLAERRVLMLIDLGVATVVGMIEDGLLIGERDWFRIDDMSLEDWLRKHGASSEAVASPPVSLLRQIVFATYDGVGAGTALYYTLRLIFTFKGAFAYKMQAGMGDVVFAPLYEVLRRRGVRFEFFRRVDGLDVADIEGENMADDDDDGCRLVIERIHIGRQAHVRGEGYRPLVDVKGLPSWPNRPLYDQLVDGDALRASSANLEDWWTRWQDPLPPVTLTRGVDFDHVVLGISIGAFRDICPQLMDRDPRFRAMVERVPTTATQAFQLWFRPDLAGLGWPLASPVVGTYHEPFDTWADMSHLIARESWPEQTVGNIAYLCSQLVEDEPLAPRSDHDYPARLRARVEANARAWLARRVRELWPNAARPDAPDALNSWFLHAPESAENDRFSAQYHTAAWNPSDRYVQSIPGSVRYRLGAHDTAFANLYLAGDWTLTALSAGCVEAAVMSGMAASRAICHDGPTCIGDWLHGSDTRCESPRTPDAGGSPDTPRYIDLDGNDAPIQPYAARGVTYYVFALNADKERLQAVCDRYLNLPCSPYRYCPLGPYVSFVAADIAEIGSTDPAGWLPERDFGFWMPVVRHQRRAGIFVPDKLLAFIPYLWVDNYLACIGGRELFGFAKGVGRLGMPENPGEPGEFSVDAFVIPEFGELGDPRAEWGYRPLIRVQKTDGGLWTELAAGVKSVGDILGTVLATARASSLSGFELPAPVLAAARALFGGDGAADGLFSVPLVFLKQFRDSADGRRAAYQAIVEAPMRVTSPGVRGDLLLGQYDVRVHQYASVSIIDNLGLYTEDGVARAAFQFWVQFDFSADPGQVVFKR